MGKVDWLKTPRSGVFLSLASSFLISVCSTGVKVTSIPVGQLTFTTYLVLFILIVIFTFNNEEELFPKKDLIRLWGLPLVSLPILIFSFTAVRLIPLSDEALISYSSIIFTIILGRLFLGEECTKNKLGASAGILIGVYLVTIGPVTNTSTADYINGFIFGLLSAIFDALSFIVLKDLSRLHFTVILYHFCIICLLITGPFCFFEKWTWEPFPLISLSIIGAIQELCVVMALTTEQAGLVCMLHASDIIFSYGWELCLFDESYTITKISGAVIVTLSVIYSAYLPADDPPTNNIQYKVVEEEPGIYQEEV